MCDSGMYSVSKQNNMLSHPDTLTSTKNISLMKPNCFKCPHGAICSGNNVVPRPNYWGFWNNGKLTFHLCPTGYCCSGKHNAPCKVYNYCAGNRTGTLCGSCRKGFSVSILTGQCMADSQCGGDQWFWLLAFLATMAYSVWYTFKDDFLWFAITFITKQNRFLIIFRKLQNKTSESHGDQKCTMSNVPEDKGLFHLGAIPLQQVVDEDINGKSNDGMSSEIEQSTYIDKGYFGILTYFVQVASVIKIQIEFSEIDTGDSFLDTIAWYIEKFLNLELAQLSFNVCPKVGLTNLGKTLFKLIFLIGIYVSWLALFIFSVIVLKVTIGKGQMKSIAHSFNKRLIIGIIEIVKRHYF